MELDFVSVAELRRAVAVGPDGESDLTLKQMVVICDFCQGHEIGGLLKALEGRMSRQINIAYITEKISSRCVSIDVNCRT